MTSDKFSGNMIINLSGGPSSVESEFDATLEAYKNFGFRVPTDITQNALMVGIGGAFMPSEMPPVGLIPEIGLQTKEYLGREVRPVLASASEKGDPKALKLAHHVGRLLSASSSGRAGFITEAESFVIGDSELTIDGIKQPYDIRTGWVADFGMGVVGLFTHIDNLRSNRYSVIAMQKTKGEKAALEGIAAHQKITREQLQIFAGGITTTSKGLIANSGPNLIDLVVASRVHEAGKDLEDGVKLASSLLRAGGLLVARGPRRYPKGTDYDKLLRIAKSDTTIRIVANRESSRKTPHGGREDNRSFIGRTNP